MLEFTSAVATLQDALTAPGAAAVFSAPPGTGKTTQVPLALVDCAWLGQQSILMLEPRRLAARAAAQRMAALRSQKVGDEIGYRVRFETRVGPTTRIEVMTEGTLVRRLQNDPELCGVGLLIFDEIHERHLQTDLALALTLDARAALRPDLRVLAMSATIAVERTCRMLGGAVAIQADGHPYPVTTEYVGGGDDRLIPTIRKALVDGVGDVLVFLPGAREIRAAATALESLETLRDVEVHQLFGEIDWAAQDRALQAAPSGRRKVVLATNIAESSLTIEGITAVVDSGLARVPRFDANAALTRLVTERISQASADQRRGRAGRVAPGRCYRLWTQSAHASRAQFQIPEVQHADLARLLLEIAAWGAKPEELQFHEPLPRGLVAQAAALLRGLGACDESDRVTALGRRLVQLPVHPRLAAMTERAPNARARALACALGAIVEEGAPWRGPLAARPIDIVAAVQALLAPKSTRGSIVRGHIAHESVARGALARIKRAHEALRRMADVHSWCANVTQEECAALLLTAFPDRIAKARGGAARGQFSMSNGRAVLIDETDTLAGAQWLVVVDAADHERGARARLAAATTLAEIRTSAADAITVQSQVRWDKRQQRVIAESVARLGRLVLASEPLTEISPAEAADAMLVGIRQMGLEVLPWDEGTRQWCARVQLVRGLQPSRGWPAVDDDTLLDMLDVWLQPFLQGITQREHLRGIRLADALGTLLAWDLRSELAQAAPTHLRVASGRNVPLHYEKDGRPVLRVLLQEMFGEAVTPTVANGQIPVQIHLLSPAKRPLQVTSDLAGFWRNSYGDVRKEMRGRYPKHAWPEDPLTATAQRGARRRR